MLEYSLLGSFNMLLLSFWQVRAINALLLTIGSPVPTARCDTISLNSSQRICLSYTTP